MNISNTSKNRDGRIVYDDPSSNPKESFHWRRIHNNNASIKEIDTSPKLLLLNNHEELLQIFQIDVDSISNNNNKENYQTIALWSCMIGYCEALTTHKDATQRYSIFPIPIDLIQRLVNDEFIPLINQAHNTVNNTKSNTSANKGETIHI